MLRTWLHDASLFLISHLGGVVIREIRLALYFVLGLLLGGSIATAHAQAPSWSAWTPDEPSSYCPTAFSASGAGQYGWTYFDYSLSYTTTGQRATCRAKCTNQSLCGAQYNTVGGFGSVANRTATCASGSYDGNGSCSDPCPSGQAATVGRFTGCYSPDGNQNGSACPAGVYIPPPAQVCNGTCWIAVSSVNHCTIPTGGGPITCELAGTTTGASCTSGDQQTIPPLSQKCPSGQSVGLVNGVAGCYASGSSSPSETTTTTSTTGDVTTKITIKVDPSTNTTTTTTTTTNNVTGTSTTQVSAAPTNPTAPMTGNENRVPGQGTLGQSPVGAASGNPSNSPEQNPTCGWPGGPPCKIDESGTPTDGALTDVKAEYEAKATERENFITSMGTQGSHGLTWDWNTWLPSGSCAPLQYGAAGHYFSIDPCEKLGLVRDLLGFLLYIFGAYVLLGIATQSPGGAK